MSLDKINALVGRLEQLTELNDFCVTHYSKQPAHFIGLKNTLNANDLPAICYEVRGQKIEIGANLDAASTDDVVLFIQINNSNESEDGYVGLLHAMSIAGMIIDAIHEDQRVGVFFVDGTIQITPIYPRTLPFFTVAIELKIIN